jgi:hypothetical protein
MRWQRSIAPYATCFWHLTIILLSWIVMYNVCNDHPSSSLTKGKKNDPLMLLYCIWFVKFISGHPITVTSGFGSFLPSNHHHSYIAGWHLYSGCCALYLRALIRTSILLIRWFTDKFSFSWPWDWPWDSSVKSLLGRYFDSFGNNLWDGFWYRFVERLFGMLLESLWDRLRNNF